MGTAIYSANVYREDQLLELVWENTNKALARYHECVGVKTGITPDAGPCLSTYWKFGSKEFIVVLNNCSSPENRFGESLALAQFAKSLEVN